MGSFTYDGLVVSVDDRALSHLQIVITQKLRRGESFLVSWKDSVDVGSGRSALWLHPGIPLRFKYQGSTDPTVNRAWIEALATSANSPRGLIMIGESGEPSTHSSTQRR